MARFWSGRADLNCRPLAPQARNMRKSTQQSLENQSDENQREASISLPLAVSWHKNVTKCRQDDLKFSSRSLGFRHRVWGFDMHSLPRTQDGNLELDGRALNEDSRYLPLEKRIDGVCMREQESAALLRGTVPITAKRSATCATSELLLLSPPCCSFPSAQRSKQPPRPERTATSAGNPANTTSLDGGPDIIANCLNAQPGQIVIFGNSRPPNIVVCNSGIYEAPPYGTGPIGILNPNPIAALDVNGNINTSTAYQIGGSSVLSIGSAAAGNLFLGVGAGISNTDGFGNTFSGYEAGYSNTAGTANIFYGYTAGYSNTTGSDNTFSGYSAGYLNTTGFNNTFYGYTAGLNNATGAYNAFYGFEAGVNNTTGSFNTFAGGHAAGTSNTTGSYNTFFGFRAGVNNTTGNNDIYIGNLGGYPGVESNTIRIGGDVGSGYGPQTAAYIAGIYGATSSAGVPVYVNSNGQLGTLPSSLRFKEQVRDMGDSTDALMKLRPVTFRYKPEYDKGERTLQYGLIAEEVAKVYPELVAYDNDGQPLHVRYQYLATMLLNEVQKQYHRAEAEAKVITAQEQKIDELEQRLSRLERLVPQTVARK